MNEERLLKQQDCLHKSFSLLPTSLLSVLTHHSRPLITSTYPENAPKASAISVTPQRDCSTTAGSTLESKRTERKKELSIQMVCFVTRHAYYRYHQYKHPNLTDWPRDWAGIALFVLLLVAAAAVACADATQDREEGYGGVLVQRWVRVWG